MGAGRVQTYRHRDARLVGCKRPSRRKALKVIRPLLRRAGVCVGGGERGKGAREVRVVCGGACVWGAAVRL